VRCEHCHATKPGVDPTSGELEDLDFASDAREAKVKAREMVKMVRAINTDYLAKMPGGAMIEVQCVTCHRGVAEPETIEARVERMVGDDGLDAALADYRELRAEYLQSGSYHLDEGPLRLGAERLLRSGEAKEAKAVLELNLEFHADAARSHALLGDAHLALDDRAAARAAYARSLELEPGNPQVKKRLEELAPEPSAPPPPPRR
jgi:tetratricopeptide (TPR) repeat protein